MAHEISSAFRFIFVFFVGNLILPFLGGLLFEPNAQKTFKGEWVGTAKMEPKMTGIDFVLAFERCHLCDRPAENL